MKAFKSFKLFNYSIRIFYKSNELLYQWHKDNENREVYFYPIGKWQFQFNEKLPEYLSFCDWRFIDGEDFHRIIRKSGILITFIKHY